uniref:HDC16877 n=1 Tax=Drosophila melanogaster TaxID=7227 RepID=Q6IIV6_DROME|nr:TPA_inf: HDC16877 [Drosophila melanogaster]
MMMTEEGKAMVLMAMQMHVGVAGLEGKNVVQLPLMALLCFDMRRSGSVRPCDIYKM